MVMMMMMMTMTRSSDMCLDYCHLQIGLQQDCELRGALDLKQHFFSAAAACSIAAGQMSEAGLQVKI